MQTKTLNFFLLLLIIILTDSCDRPQCKNANPIFDEFTPDAREYKNELAKQMKAVGLENLKYWFDKSQEENDKETCELYIQGDGICAKIIVENKSNRKKLGNGGYRGVELKGVIIKSEQDSIGTNFVLENIDKIID